MGFFRWFFWVFLGGFFWVGFLMPTLPRMETMETNIREWKQGNNQEREWNRVKNKIQNGKANHTEPKLKTGR